MPDKSGPDRDPKMNKGNGAGVFCPHPIIRRLYYPNGNCSIFQLDMFAMKGAAEMATEFSNIIKGMVTAVNDQNRITVFLATLDYVKMK